MQRIFFALLLFVVASVVSPTDVLAVRYAQCDKCGLCKDTIKTNATTTTSYYVQPDRWQQCFECLYADYVLSPHSPVPCGVDDLNRTPEFHTTEGVLITDTRYRCDTLVMTPFSATPPTYPTPANEPTIVPQSGRMFSDIGCISVDTANQRFSDPNASVDVIQVLLNLVISATGGIGTILVIFSAAQLMLSKGDPEKIRQARKRLTNVVLGLLFTLFGLFIFRFFAAQVLRIPGFN